MDACLGTLPHNLVSVVGTTDRRLRARGRLENATCQPSWRRPRTQSHRGQPKTSLVDEASARLQNELVLRAPSIATRGSLCSWRLERPALLPNMPFRPRITQPSDMLNSTKSFDLEDRYHD